jgi:transposase
VWLASRAMVEAADIPRDLSSLVVPCRGSMRTKTGRLKEAFTGRLTDHHAFLLRTMLARIDGITTDIDLVQARIDEQIAPFAEVVTRLDEIPGVGVTTAQAIIAEVGVDMARFPTPDHLASRARFAPGISESAGRIKGNSGTGKGNRYLARALGEAAVGVRRTDTFLGERYRRIVKRRGKKKAIVAVGRSILMIVWQLLNDDEKRFVDLGSGYYESHVNQNRRTRNHVRELQALGYKVTLGPAA